VCRRRTGPWADAVGLSGCSAQRRFAQSWRCVVCGLRLWAACLGTGVRGTMPSAAAGSAKLLLAPMLRHERLTAVLPLHSATAVLAGRLTVKIHWEEPRPVHRTTQAATASFAHTHTRTGVRLDGSFVCTCGRLSNARFCFAATRNPSTCAGSKASMKRSHGCGAC
jgi:hypothetical protein